MTPEQHRDHAELVMREYLLDLHDITEVKDYLGRSLPSEDAATVVALIRTANVEITWPVPCPACGVVGCTEHPTWAAESEPAEPAITPLGWTTLGGKPDGLAPAQEIRLRLTEALLGSDGYVGVPNLAADVTAVVLPLAQMVETGEHDTADQPLPPFRRPEVDEVRAWLDAHAPIPGWSSVDSLKEALKVSEENRDLAEARLAQIEDLWKDRDHSEHYGLDIVRATDLRACLDWVPEEPVDPMRKIGENLAAGLKPYMDGFQKMADTINERLRTAPKPAGYSDTLRIPGTDTSVVAVPGGGFERVVTAQVPGGLLSEPEAPVAALPVVTPNDTPGSVDDPL